MFKLKRAKISDEERLRKALEEQDRLRREQQALERRKQIQDLEKRNEELKRKNKAMNREIRMNDGGDMVGQFIKFGGQACRGMGKVAKEVAREAGNVANEMAAAANQPEPKRRGKRSRGRRRKKVGAWDAFFGDNFGDTMSDGPGRGIGVFTGKGLRKLDRHPFDL